MLSQQQTITKLTNSEKSTSDKLQTAEMKLIQAREREENHKKQIKILEEKVNSGENSLEYKNEELLGMNEEK